MRATSWSALGALGALGLGAFVDACVALGDGVLGVLDVLGALGASAHTRSARLGTLDTRCCARRALVMLGTLGALETLGLR